MKVKNKIIVFLFILLGCEPYVPCPNNEYITLGFPNRNMPLRYLKITKIIKNSNSKKDSFFVDLKSLKLGSTLTTEILKVENMYDYDYLITDTLNNISDTVINISYKKLQVTCKQNIPNKAVEVSNFNFKINKKEYFNYEKYDQKIIFLDK